MSDPPYPHFCVDVTPMHATDQLEVVPPCTVADAAGDSPGSWRVCWVFLVLYLSVGFVLLSGFPYFFLNYFTVYIEMWSTERVPAT